MSITDQNAHVEPSTTPAGERHDTVVALRALADLIEHTPDLPVPHVYASINYWGYDDTTRAQIRRAIVALAPTEHGDVAHNADRYEFRRTFSPYVSLVISAHKDGLFDKVVKETAVFELPADLAALAEGRS